MPEERQNPENEIAQKSPTTTTIFDDPESRRNLVGLFDLLFKIDKRINPELYGIEKDEDKNKEIKS